MRLIPADSPILARQLEVLRDPQRLWSEHGLRSLRCGVARSVAASVGCTVVCAPVLSCANEALVLTPGRFTCCTSPTHQSPPTPVPAPPPCTVCTAAAPPACTASATRSTTRPTGAAPSGSTSTTWRWRRCATTPPTRPPAAPWRPAPPSCMASCGATCCARWLGSTVPPAPSGSSTTTRRVRRWRSGAPAWVWWAAVGCLCLGGGRAGLCKSTTCCSICLLLLGWCRPGQGQPPVHRLDRPGGTAGGGQLISASARLPKWHTLGSLSPVSLSLLSHSTAPALLFLRLQTFLSLV